MSTSSALRRAVARVLALPAFTVAVGCGGSVTTVTTAPQDGGDAQPDQQPPVDPDSGIMPDAAFDGRTPDGGCRLPPPSTNCGSRTVTCLPEGALADLQTNSGRSGTCDQICPMALGCNAVEEDAGIVLTCLCGGGRFPEGLELETNETAKSAAEVLATYAALERAAVVAFQQLAWELAAYGAPRELVRRVRVAAKDEVHHAQSLGRAARARGAKVPRFRTKPAAEPRSLLQIALENAVEGCGREAIGAAQLCVQAAQAKDETLRPLFADIAKDEIAHAELSMDLAAWLATRLDAESREAVTRARRDFFAACATRPPTEEPLVAATLGLPAKGQWRALVQAVAEELAA